MMRFRTVPNEAFVGLFTARLDMLQALATWKAKANLDNDGASVLRRFIDQVGSVPGLEGAYPQCAALLEIALHMGDWIRDVKAAQHDADRHYRAARHKLTEFIGALPSESHPSIRTAATRLGELREPTDVRQVPEILCAVDLPLPLVKASDRAQPTPPAVADEAESEIGPCVGVVAFKLDQALLSDGHVIQPSRIHDLKLEMRLSRWDERATSLVVEPITVEPGSTYEMPVFEFERPSGEPPYALNATGRLVLRIPQTILSRPLEFSYRARFEPEGERVIVEGHRSLRLQSHDPRAAPITGYRYVDDRLLQLRDGIRSVAGIPDEEIGWFLQIMAVLGRTAGEALQDHLFPGEPTENEFQADIRKRLRADPGIGSSLEVHAQAGGGITDLSFMGIRIELKVANERDLTPSRSARYFGQTTQYARASDRRLAVLCLLDSAPKSAAPPEPADDMALENIESASGNATTVLGIVVVRGNLARPSDLSRKAHN